MTAIHCDDLNVCNFEFKVRHYRFNMSQQDISSGRYLPRDDTAQSTELLSRRQTRFESPIPLYPLSTSSHMASVDPWHYDTGTSSVSLQSIDRNLPHSPRRSSPPLPRPDSRSSHRSSYAPSSLSYPTTRQSSYTQPPSGPAAHLESLVSSLTNQVADLSGQLTMLRYLFNFSELR